MSARRGLWVVTVVVVVTAVLVLFVVPWLRQELAPQPVAAWIAVETGDSGVARRGPVIVAAGTSCELHAVLEARRRDGSALYYSEAPGLEVDGVPVVAEDLASWPGPLEARLLWFTVEARRPVQEVPAGEVPTLTFGESFRPEWPRTWSIPCLLEPSSEAFARGLATLGRQEFGTQRYQVRIELYSTVSRIAPAERFVSPRADQLPGEVASFPGVVAHLEGSLAAPSSVFGLAQIRLEDPAAPQARRAVARWTEGRLAFSRGALLTETLLAAGTSWEALEWRTVDLEAGPGWGEAGFAPGDLVRVGERIVFLFADRGTLGVLDEQDLCFDYEKGPGLRPLGEVYSGDGLVEWAELARARRAGREMGE